MKKLITITLLSIALAGCSHKTQTTSGREYLAQYSQVPVSEGSSVVRADGTKERLKSIDERVRDAAAVEPVLKFPARIGIARITDGALTNMPPEEAASWDALCTKLGPGFGECVPVSPMIARMVSSGERYSDSLNTVVDTIRLGAARQHLDAVLVYEVLSRESSHKNILAVANLSIIGGYVLPSQTHDAVGLGNALLIDVVQAYPYGTLSTTVDKESRVSSSWGWGSDYKAGEKLADKIKAQAAKQLADEAYDMFNKLRNELGWAHQAQAGRLEAEKTANRKKH
ncbi:MAG: hypothetical protein K0R10_2344 [Alphaproteobacteria bacterium]|jgi:hypothetical protein|nr:hypothetical protein [Alphaproteobacteria bacterium]